MFEAGARRVLGLVLAGLLAGCSESSSESPPAPSFTPDPPFRTDLQLHVPSPDWRDQVIYFVMIDRFNDGDPTNNDQGAGEYDPSRNSHYSGGDLQGLIDQLDYIQALGATAVWITPPVANQWWDPVVQFGGYHGYWARDFRSVDEHYGDLETYAQLSHELHKRGMYLIQDIVTNHTGNFFYWPEQTYDPSNPSESFSLNTQTVPTTAPTQRPFSLNNLNDPEHALAEIYHWTPTIQNLNVREQELTWALSNLDDLRTENPVVRDALRDAYGYWISTVGVDGFRIDTVRYVEHEFWNDFIHRQDGDDPGVNTVAAAHGKQDFLTFGEVFDISAPFSDDAERFQATYLGTPERPELQTNIQFPLYGEILNVFAGGAPTASMTYRTERWMDRSLFPNPFITPTFLDNHDVQRFLRSGSEDALRQALTFLMTSPGIPVLYYGTEQRFNGDPRQAMFAGGFESEGRDHFDQDSEMFGFIRELTALRTQHEVLRRGELATVQDAVFAAGVYAMERVLGEDKAIIVFNTAETEVLLTGLSTGLPPGTLFETPISLNMDEPVVAQFDGSLTMELAPRAALVLLPTETREPTQAPAARISIATNLAGQRLTQDTQVEGTYIPDTELRVIIDDYIARGFDVSTDSEGRFSFILDMDLFPIRETATQHTMTVYDPAVGLASPRVKIETQPVFDGVIVEGQDPEGDDDGPNDQYFYPMDGSFAQVGNTCDVTGVRLEAGGTTLRMFISLKDHSTIWAPSNGFDHVSFNIYFDVPGQEGMTLLPRIQATAPEGFAWDYTHFIFGWLSSVHTIEGADEANWGTAIPAAPEASFDEATKTLSLSYDRTALGLSSWDGVKVYITTWDFDGIGADYRPLEPEGAQWSFGGGAATDPYIMDDAGPYEIMPQ